MFIDQNFRANRPMPSDVTLRVPVYRRQGIVASLIAGLASAWDRFKEAREISRLEAGAHHLPDYLREDIGLPPAPPTHPLGREPLRW